MLSHLIDLLMYPDDYRASWREGELFIELAHPDAELPASPTYAPGLESDLQAASSAQIAA